MKNTLLALVAFFGIFVCSAAAADVTGKWVASTPGRDGNAMTTTFNLKADGDAVTGTVTTPRGEQPISEGKLSGDSVSFVVAMNFNGNDVRILYKGKVDGNQISFSRQREGADRTQDFVAKRSE